MTILMDIGLLKTDDLAGQDIRQMLAVLFPIFWGGELQPPCPVELFLGITHQLGKSRIGFQDGAIQRGDVDAFCQRIEDLPPIGLLLGKLSFLILHKACLCFQQVFMACQHGPYEQMAVREETGRRMEFTGQDPYIGHGLEQEGWRDTGPIVEDSYLLGCGSYLLGRGGGIEPFDEQAFIGPQNGLEPRLAVEFVGATAQDPCQQADLARIGLDGVQYLLDQQGRQLLMGQLLGVRFGGWLKMPQQGHVLTGLAQGIDAKAEHTFCAPGTTQRDPQARMHLGIPGCLSRLAPNTLALQLIGDEAVEGIARLKRAIQ